MFGTSNDSESGKRTLKKLKWTAKEDQDLINAVARHGTESWVKVSQYVQTRTGKQCRERWIGQLSPCLGRNKWTSEEDKQLLDLHDRHGNKWTAIANQLSGRSAISVKNRWNWLVRHSLASPSFESNQEKLPTLAPLAADFGRPFELFQAWMFSSVMNAEQS